MTPSWRRVLHAVTSHTQTHTHTHAHTLTHSLSLSHTHTHTHTHSLSHTHKHTHTHNTCTSATCQTLICHTCTHILSHTHHTRYMHICHLSIVKAAVGGAYCALPPVTHTHTDKHSLTNSLTLTHAHNMHHWLNVKASSCTLFKFNSSFSNLYNTISLCCSVWLCVAVCGCVLQCVNPVTPGVSIVVCCCILQGIMINVERSVLQCVAVCCSVL